MAGPPLLELRRVWKGYQPGQYVVRDASLMLEVGEIHGLMGGNGAGKSTLMKIVAGAHAPTHGDVLWKGRSVRWSSPADARSAGISTVYQQIPLAPDLSVMENVFLAEGGPLRSGRGLRRRYAEIAAATGYHVDPDVMVGTLSIGQRQLVAIMQALSTRPELLILDEPTASLAEHERDLLFATVRSVAAQGTSVIFCSHFIEEVLGLTQRMTIMRSGEVVLSAATAEVTPEQATLGIAGRRLYAVEHAHQPHEVSPQSFLDIRGMRLQEDGPGFDLQVHAGEVLGLAGLMGSGRSRLLRCLFGAAPLLAASASLKGASYPRSVRDAVRRGVAYVGEDRMAQSLFPEWEVWRNLSFPRLAALSRSRTLERVASERLAAGAVVEKLSVACSSIDAPVSSLSGGNAQKVAIGRWLVDRRPDLLLLDDPTVGVDVGAKADIVAMLRRLSAEGTTVVVSSSDFAELTSVCDRIAIVTRGAVNTVVHNRGLDVADIVGLINGYSDSDLDKE